jgi:demethylspheroidene O-methyltransferase
MRLSWPDAALNVRDRLLASPRFQQFAAAFPVTRPIARRRARALFDLVAGFVYSQVLAACVRLNLFDILAKDGPQTLAALSGRLTLSLDATRRLLAAAVALDLVEKRAQERFGLGSLGSALVGNPGIVAMIEHHRLLYADLDDPVGLLRGEQRASALGLYWPYAGSAAPKTLSEDQVAGYTALMAASQPLVSGEILAAYSFSKHRCLLDVGGGDGTFLTTVAASAPALQLVLFDLPMVVERAKTRFLNGGLSDRARVVGGDFLRDPIPAGADIITLVRVVHDHDDASVIALLTAVRRALPADGVLLIAEPMAETPGAEPMGDAYFGFYLLAMGRGRPRTAKELEQLLQRSGFKQTRTIPTRMPLQTCLILAHPG